MNQPMTLILITILANSLLNEFIHAIPVNETSINITAVKKTIDVCTDDFCKNNGTCFINALNKKECNCTLTSFTGPACENQTTKEEVTMLIEEKKIVRLSCPENICQNHGECYIGPDKKPMCDCSKTSFNGTLCNEPLCPPDFCENGGVCKIVNNKIRYCDCSTIMFTGSLCQFPKCSIGFCPSYETCVVDYFQKKLSCETGDVKKKHKNCLEFPCQNNGTCIIKYNGEPECDCTNTGYSGIFCETPVCEKVNCNNGQCRFNLSDDKKTYCLCEPGYRGRFCEEKYCPDHYCFNGGICSVDQKANLTCQCQPGYEGYRCEHRKVCGDCDQGYCQRNPETNKFECICDEHFTGENCSKLKPCPDNYCNGGKCELDKRSYKCICDPNKSGPRCETSLT